MISIYDVSQSLPLSLPFYSLFSLAEKGLEVRIMADALTNYFKYLLRRNLSELNTKTAAIAQKGNLTATQIQVFVPTVCVIQKIDLSLQKDSCFSFYLSLPPSLSLSLSLTLTPTHNQTLSLSLCFSHSLSLSGSLSFFFIIIISLCLSLSLSSMLQDQLMVKQLTGTPEVKALLKEDDAPDVLK